MQFHTVGSMTTDVTRMLPECYQTKGKKGLNRFVKMLQEGTVFKKSLKTQKKQCAAPAITDHSNEWFFVFN